MHRILLLACPFAVCLLSQAAVADDMPTALSCEFKTGTSWSYDGGKFQSRPSAQLSFEIESIDLDRQSAILKASSNAKPGTLAIARAIGANHFLEVATEGFWNITTVYALDPATGMHPTVHSRHIGLIGQPVFSQYAGTCKPK
jgi:hypothetical protein